MKSIFMVLILSVYALCVGCGTSHSDYTSSVEFSPKALLKDLNSPDGEIRVQLAKRLAKDHCEETFQILLVLLKDKNVDVSYAAAEAIELRGDENFDKEFIETIKSLPRESRWPAYRAEKNYPTKHTVNFLLNCLQEEIVFYQKQKNFDERNSFYIARSLENICDPSREPPNVSAPDSNTLAAYEKLMSDLQTRVKAFVSVSGR
jgi:HEAT repeat protein